jgi:predicted AAA+ superfamily ATPase
MYVQRILSKALRHSLDAFPAVLVTGPRQSGKTTFLRHEVGERYR